MKDARKFVVLSVLTIVGCVAAPDNAPVAGSGKQLVPAQPLVIAHRGASGYLPEHKLAAKAMAYGQGADYIEQDPTMDYVRSNQVQSAQIG